MTKYTDLEQRTVHHMCVYGDPKTGKSTIVAMLAEAGYPLVWISCDNGHGVLRKLSKEAKERVEIIVIPDTANFPVAIQTCRRLVKGGLKRICDRHGQIDCAVCVREKSPGWTEIDLHKLPRDTIVVWDHGTQIQDSGINFITAKATDGNQDKIDMFKPEYAQWRMLGALMLQFLTEIQQAPFNTIVIANQVEGKMEDDSKRLLPFLGTTNFSTSGGGYFDHVVYCHLTNGSHKFGSSSTYKIGVLTGSRDDVAIEKMEKPSLAPFFKVVRTERKENETSKVYGSEAAKTALSSGDNGAADISVVIDSDSNKGLETDVSSAEKATAEAKPTDAVVSTSNESGVTSNVVGASTSALTDIKAKLAAMRMSK